MDRSPTSNPGTARQAPGARTVLVFWLGDALERGWPSQNRLQLWFGGGKALDADITARFGALVYEALAGGLSGWESDPLERLALVILLDQFTRNVHRGSPRAFAGDARAQDLVRDALARGWKERLPLAGRVFMLMPLMHAESLASQDECLRWLEALADSAPGDLKKELQGHLDSAREHRAIIALFGRFPYRNAVLERTNAPGEDDFLRNGKRFGQ